MALSEPTPKEKVVFIVIYGCVFGFMCASILTFFNTLSFFGAQNIPARIGTAFYYALAGPIFSLFIFGIPWLILTIANALVLTLLTASISTKSAFKVLLVGQIVGVIGVLAFKIFVVTPLLIAQPSRDRFSLGMERHTLGLPFWCWILFIVYLTGLYQTYLAFRKLGTLSD